MLLRGVAAGNFEVAGRVRAGIEVLNRLAGVFLGILKMWGMASDSGLWEGRAVGCFHRLSFGWVSV